MKDWYEQNLEGSSATYCGEKYLLGAVLVLALADACGDSGWSSEPNPLVKQREQKDAQAWIFSNENYCSPEKGVSFVFVCDHLNLDPNMVRQAIEDGALKGLRVGSVFRGRAQRKAA